MKKSIFIIELIILNFTAFADAVKYDVAAYVWPAYGQKDPSV